jgi:membrane protease YdiL (CAAX protease family)
MPPEADRDSLQTQSLERGSAWVLLPIAATVGYYLLPAFLRADTLVQFIPQLFAYLALFLWGSCNQAVRSRLGLDRANVLNGLRWGFLTGLLLGGMNTFVILAMYPSLGYDITFLKQTPHGRLPVFVMIPWLIVVVAIFVEINFRGFILGRLAAMESRLWRPGLGRGLSPLALITSSLIFVFDPFMIHTFQHLHWIALWDGLIWGAIRLWTGNLYAAIFAHGLEVTLLYLAVRAALG